MQQVVTDLMNNSAVTTGWSTNANAGDGYIHTCNSLSFFGGNPNFGTGVYASKTYTGLSPHYQATLSVQLFFLDSWDNETYYIKADDVTVYQETWNYNSAAGNICSRLAFGDKISTITTSQFPHTALEITLNFTTTLASSGSDASFGFNNIQITLDACDFSCIACSGPSNTQCSACASGWYLVNTTCILCDAACSVCSGPGNTACSSCNVGWYLIDTTCTLCNSACSNCTGPSATECSSCNTGWYLNDTTCTPCNSACGACTGPDITNCTSCNSGWLLDETTCGTSCPTGYYGNTTTNTCESKLFSKV